MSLTLAEYMAQATARDRDSATLECCKQCQVPLQEALQGYRKVGDCAHCSDCYFSRFSELVDQYPVGRPMASRMSSS